MSSPIRYAASFALLIDVAFISSPSLKVSRGSRYTWLPPIRDAAAVTFAPEYPANICPQEYLHRQADTLQNFRHRGDRIGVPRSRFSPREHSAYSDPRNFPTMRWHCPEADGGCSPAPHSGIRTARRNADRTEFPAEELRSAAGRVPAETDGAGSSTTGLMTGRLGGVRIIHIAPRNGFLRNRGPLCLRFRGSTRLGIHAGKQYHRMNEHYYRQNNKDGAVLLHFQPLTFSVVVHCLVERRDERLNRGLVDVGVLAGAVQTARRSRLRRIPTYAIAFASAVPPSVRCEKSSSTKS